MSSTLPRRVVQAALLVAAGAAPVVGAASAHAVDVPGGNAPIDVPGVPRTDVTGIPFLVNGITDAVRPVMGLSAVGAVDQAVRPGVAQAETGLASSSPNSAVGTAAGPGVAAVLENIDQQAPDLRDNPAVRVAQRVAPHRGVVKLVQPAVDPLSHPVSAPPSADQAVRGTDAVARRLQAQVAYSATAGLRPALPVAGYATDKSVNAAIPASDRTIALSTGRRAVTNAALTTEGLTTPMREMPPLI